VQKDYGRFSAWTLRNLTHEEFPWIYAYEKGKSEISIEDMKSYFRATLATRDKDDECNFNISVTNSDNEVSQHYVIPHFETLSDEDSEIFDKLSKEIYEDAIQHEQENKHRRGTRKKV